jgi:hypothetical protein
MPKSTTRPSPTTEHAEKASPRLAPQEAVYPPLSPSPCSKSLSALGANSESSSVSVLSGAEDLGDSAGRVAHDRSQSDDAEEGDGTAIIDVPRLVRVSMPCVTLPDAHQSH